MPGFRLLDQFPVYFDRLGAPAVGGHLAFFDTGTDTPKDVFGDPDLTVNNGPTVLIDTAGRTVVDIWGSGSYRVRLIAVDGTLIAEADDVEIPGGDGAAIPTLQSGKFLTNDGAVLAWQAIIQPPDPTGSANKVLGTDGVNLLWQDPPASPPPAVSDVAVSDTSFSISDGTKKVLIQTGTGTAPNNGGRDTSLAIVFPTPFIATPMFFSAMPNYDGTVSNYGNAPIPHAAAVSLTGMTIALAGGERDDSNAGYNFNTAIGFKWMAVGLVAA